MPTQRIFTKKNDKKQVKTT